MAGRFLLSPARALLKPSRCGQKVLTANYSDHDPPVLVYDIKKGREVVGFGPTGDEAYVDDIIFPYPAIRYKRIEGELIALKEKEKGDWKLLTKDEIKTLYRASFGQTFAEMLAPTGRWKLVLAQTLFGISAGLVLFLMSEHLIPRHLPDTLSLEHRQKMLKGMIDARFDGITGLASKWDYDKDDWKK